MQELGYEGRPWAREGTWVACTDSNTTILGTIVRLPLDRAIHVRVVAEDGERMIRFSLARSNVRALSVLEVLAVVSQPFYFENPDLRLCEYEGCVNPIDPMKGLYCSRECAISDA